MIPRRQPRAEKRKVVPSRDSAHLAVGVTREKRIGSFPEPSANGGVALAETVDRDYRAVHNDVTLLADYGLVFLVDDGRSKRPYLPYQRIHLDVELVGPGEEPAPA